MNGLTYHCRGIKLPNQSRECILHNNNETKQNNFSSNFHRAAKNAVKCLPNRKIKMTAKFSLHKIFYAMK